MAPNNSSGFDGSKGIYTPLRPTTPLPTDPSLSMASFLFHRARRHKPRIALVDAVTGRSLTYSSLERVVRGLALTLRRRFSVRRGDVVLLFAPNSPDYAVVFLAVLSLGAVPTTADPSYTALEVLKQTEDSRPRLLFTIPDLWNKVKGLLVPIVFFGSRETDWGQSGVTWLADLYPSPSPRASNTNKNGDMDDWLKIDPPPVGQSDVAALLYSSGTAGTNKGVVLTHRNFITAATMITSDQDNDGDPTHTFLCFLPMFHIFGLGVITYAQLYRGNTVGIMPRFDMDLMLRSIERYSVTQLCMVPPVAIELAKQGKATMYNLSSLRRLFSGAAPLRKEIMDEVSQVFPLADIVQGYGLTETCGIVTMQDPKHSTIFGTTGTLVSGIEGKVISIDSMKPLPPNELGELCFRGPNIMQGYLNNPEATKLILDGEGWLRTGDLGYFDNQGNLFVVDRIKELIKCKGFQVAPAELEGLLLSHPEVLDAVVISYPDAEAGEVPIAFVVRSRKSLLTEVKVQEFIAEQVAYYKRLRRVTFVDSIPKSASGKILRRELKVNIPSKI